MSVPATDSDETWYDQDGNEISEEEARQNVAVRNVIFGGIYFAWSACVLLLYIKKRKK